MSVCKYKIYRTQLLPGCWLINNVCILMQCISSHKIWELRFHFTEMRINTSKVHLIKCSFGGLRTPVDRAIFIFLSFFSGCSFYFTQNISERNITETANLPDLLGRSRFYSFNIHTKYRESSDKPILTKRGIPRCWFTFCYDQRNFDLHLTQIKLCNRELGDDYTTGTRIPDPPFSLFGPSRDYGMDFCLEVYLWTIYPYFTTFRVTTLSFY